ncbi:MAG: 16S rRNA (cytosine(967)-C(5))-methyltransferase RsmB, partial [Limnohabitans sp.]
QALLFAVLRQWGRTLVVQKALVQRSPPAPVDDLLCVGLALALPDTQGMYPIHTLVNQLVEAAKRDPATRAQAGFINACVRRFDRERFQWISQSEADLSARWNHPDWWIKTLQQDHPMHWQAVLGASQQAAPMAVRVNCRQQTVDNLQAVWLTQGLVSKRCGPSGLVLAQPQAVHTLPGFEQGWCSVQDPGAQMAAPLLLTGLQPSDSPRLRVLDACAAPGGKTAHLLELANLDLLAIDVEEARCQRVRENLQRLQLKAEVRCANALTPADWWDGRPWDAILLDAPCTASGIVRRHPDIPWLRRQADLAALTDMQKRMLQALWPGVRRGGRLLYCTCSLFRAEGERQIQSFLVNNSDASCMPSPGYLLPSMPSSGGAVSDNLPQEHDGFFYALLEKQ